MIAFRPATIDDAESIAALHAKSWQQHYQNVFSNQFLNDEVEHERLLVWNKRLGNPSQNQFVQIAEKNGSLVGFVCGYYNDHPDYGTLIDNLHVNSKFIGQRIGQHLMANAAALIKKNCKSTSMYLWVLTGNIKAMKFYERIGGTPLETINDFDIGDREITKTRYYWSNMEFVLKLNSQQTNDL